jgi:geranylgeranyl diphosphate synthase type I
MTRPLQPYLTAIDEDLQRMLQATEPMVLPLYQMMQYHLGWLDADLCTIDAPKGKRLRPLLCALACEAVGGDWHSALPAASAIELIHNFSLVHDDIEDNSLTRRHRPTVWSLWGIAQGINTGDTLWVISRLATLRLAEEGHDPRTVLRIVRLFDETCLALCTGQYLDIRFESVDSVTMAEYQRMIAGKTAALLSASLAAGAILGGADASKVEDYASFGRELGITFQIVDDMLGIWGDPAVTGKSAASDILEKKKTIPILHTLEWERQQGYEDLRQIYCRPTLTEQEIPTILTLLERAGAREAIRRQAREHQERTLAYLDRSERAHPAQRDLCELALSLLERST